MRIPSRIIHEYEEGTLIEMNEFINDVVAAFSDRAYGTMYQDNNTELISIASQDTNYIITGFSFVDHLTGVQSSGTSALTCNNPGIYYTTWHISFTSTGPNIGFEVSLGINGVRQPEGTSHAVTTATGKEVLLGGVACVRLKRDDYINLFILNHDGTQDATIEHASMTVCKIDD